MGEHGPVSAGADEGRQSVGRMSASDHSLIKRQAKGKAIVPDCDDERPINDVLQMGMDPLGVVAQRFGQNLDKSTDTGGEQLGTNRGLMGSHGDRSSQLSVSAQAGFDQMI